MDPGTLVVMELDVLLGPADFAALDPATLGGTACLVFDVLRATSTIATAFANGARGILPVSTIDEAVALRLGDGALLLAGERNGLRIEASQTGGVEFDLGNSPREFLPAVVGGRRLVMTTTNGTRALRACAPAPWVAAASFLNLRAAVDGALASGCPRLLFVGAGTGEEPALEDVLAAGAAVQGCLEAHRRREVLGLSDAARIALATWQAAQPDWVSVLARAKNARRLLALPDLAPDVDWCCQLDRVSCVPRLVGGAELRGAP